MTDLRIIDQKIVELQNKKLQLEQKMAIELYKKLESLLDEHFTPELVLGIVSTQLSNLSTQETNWQELGATFFRQSRSSKITQTPKKD